MIDVTFKCMGCRAEVTVRNAIQNKFHSFNGKGHGFGVRRETRVSEICPAGWIPFDPYTQVTYCPACWADIER